MKELVIFGSGGFAREVHQIVDDINASAPSWRFRGFLDDNQDNHGKEVHGFPVLGGAQWLSSQPDVAVTVAVGGTASKRKVVQQLHALVGERFASLIHPRAWIGRNVAVGVGSIVCAGVMITTDVRIGKHVILNLGCTVGHDTEIGDYATLAPSVNISGCVSVGEGSDIGTNATVIQGIAIGEWSIVGASAVAVKSLPGNITAVGMPAKAIKERQSGWHLE